MSIVHLVTLVLGLKLHLKLSFTGSHSTLLILFSFMLLLIVITGSYSALVALFKDSFSRPRLRFALFRSLYLFVSRVKNSFGRNSDQFLYINTLIVLVDRKLTGSRMKLVRISRNRPKTKPLISLFSFSIPGKFLDIWINFILEPVSFSVNKYYQCYNTTS